MLSTLTGGLLPVETAFAGPATLSGAATAYSLDGAGNRWSETTAAVTTSFDLDLNTATPTVLFDGTKKYLPGNPGAGFEQAGTWWSALHDIIGSPTIYVSQAGAQTSPVHYDPYGTVRPGSSASAGIGFGGEWRDPAGLINLRARAYDPASARFVGRDTYGGVASAPQSANRYAYAQNNPFRYTDPSGHFVTAVGAHAPLFASIFLQSIPVVGDAYSALTGFVGYDPIAGISLSDSDRAIAIGSALLIGGGAHLLGHLGSASGDARLLDRAGEATGGARQARLGGGIAAEGGGTTLFRSMRVAEDGTPLTGPTARTLGIRPGEIPTDAAGMVQPRTGGMSVAPDSPYNLQPHRLPVEMGGTGKDPLWRIGESDLGPSLSYRADPELEGHGFIEPSGPMSLEDYISALEGTAGSWSRT